MGKSIIIALLPFVAVAIDHETKLVDRLIKAQRAVEKANAQSSAAGKDLSEYCQSVGKTAQVKPNGLLGCWTSVPAKPPGTAQ